MFSDKEIAREYRDKALNLANLMYNEVKTLQGKVPEDEHKKFRGVVGNGIVDVFDKLIKEIETMHPDLKVADMPAYADAEKRK
ncbi:hypothetical protein [Pectobacterium brasiliense]|uniref:hypothetical protein n=1 Tax=Pectobacterium brasiliense TaxID=180957 RepID=UPI0005833203|nr:hypothetical protein [Pectobacterium brasiliense]KHS78156.1 hypothetical protein RC81_14540 [Pectobacterium brasiliense]